jgi:hypothetical protein
MPCRRFMECGGFGRKQDAVRHSAAFHGIAEQCDLIVIHGMSVRSKSTALLRMGSHCRILRPLVRSVRRSSAGNCTPLSLVRYASSKSETTFRLRRYSTASVVLPGGECVRLEIYPHATPQHNALQVASAAAIVPPAIIAVSPSLAAAPDTRVLPNPASGPRSTPKVTSRRAGVHHRRSH